MATLTKTVQKTTVNSRLTVEQACENLLENSELKKLEGSTDLYLLGLAAEHDGEKADELISKLVSDLNLLIRKRGRKLKHRVKFAGLGHNRYSLFAHAFKNHIQSILHHVGGDSNGGFTRNDSGPTSPLTYLNPSRRSDELHFENYDKSNMLVKRTLASVGYIDPDDFPRRVPKSVTKALKVLKTTHFNYEPKIMDGILVKEEYTTIRARDPGLIISLGKFCDLMVYYWKEPFRNNLDRFWDRNTPLFAMGSLLMAFIAVVFLGSLLMQIRTCPGDFWSILVLIPVGLASFVMGAIGCVGTFALGYEVFKEANYVIEV